jgi:predicted naringenin-chalcone synthase
VPGRLAEALASDGVAELVTGGEPLEAIEAWAIHPGGKSIVDAVERGLRLVPEKVADSRAVLQDCGNMSSATVLFVLERLMRARPANGIALAFGPGLAMEGVRFGWTGDDGR